MRMFKQIMNFEGQSLALQTLVKGYLQNKQPTQAAQAAQDAAEWFKKSERRDLEGVALDLKAEAHAEKKEWDKAILAAEDSAKAFSTAEETRQQAMVLHKLANWNIS